MIHTPTNDNLAYCEAQWVVKLGQVGEITKFTSRFDAERFVVNNFNVKQEYKDDRTTAYSGHDITISVNKL